jgi:hypothetical protein
LTLKKITKVLENRSSDPKSKSVKNTKTTEKFDFNENGFELDFGYDPDYEQEEREFFETLNREQREMDEELRSQDKYFDDYFSTLVNNSYQKAQQTYANNYGETELNTLLNPSQIKPPKKTN